MIRAICFSLLVLSLSGCESRGADKAPTSNPTAEDSSNSSPGNRSRPAPDFTLKDLQGNAVQLSSLRGKGVVLAFWFFG